MTPRLYRLKEVSERTGLGRTTIYERVRDGKFPAPLPLFPGSRNVAWVAEEIDEYVLGLIRAARPAVAELASVAG